LVSTKAFDGAWHDAHDCVPFPERIGSKKSFLPNAIPSTVCGLLLGINGGGNVCAKIAGITNGAGVGGPIGIGVGGGIGITFSLSFLQE